ncbi:MAG: gfo/Idh/MocA family oxidoreductase [Planctomycetota bacterium]|nr:MAG: gfo/Idh/MocA family oxidoreductase [Planctomycetota bacterium]REJ96060.1 MAG: gfo/Idh/MocA family oxidoreductase [Planctomycetota bacterium]REK31076.1 MAG: gfo/Idh/MocA family oxidoreductase [Planctomycetota bacterium]REK36810.1 MAG: gfo/Idh/MocA family oxidoreductase [Planctomycetota bacterium]
MTTQTQSRRDFLKSATTAAAAGSLLPYWFTTSGPSALAYQSPNERPVLGCIGTGDRWHAVGRNAMAFSDCVAVCDVDANHMGAARDIAKAEAEKRGVASEVAMHEDYRHILDDPKVDVVTIVTPDHWHSKIAIEALQAGKDIYCEKPLTLTILEGKQIIKVLEETNRVFQVGTQQRSEMGNRFLTAIALIRDGRIGKVQRVTCDIGGAPVSGSIPVVDVPEELNWERWLGQAPLVEYRYKDAEPRYGNSRCHYEFRWWYEYSGGKMTDWGAHHVDIAQWAIDQSGPDQGPVSVEGTSEHPVPFENGWPTQEDRYNTATKFDVTVMFPNGVEMHIVSESPDGNGILFEGTEGRFHVSRGALKGKPVEDLEANPLPDGAIQEVYGGKEPGNHMQNFMDCVKSRETPISDVWSHHRAMTTCHLANIAIRLDRRLEWDPVEQQIIGDSGANQWQTREQRKGYEIDVSV